MFPSFADERRPFLCEKFWSSFFKSSRFPKAEPLVALLRARTPLTRGAAPGPARNLFEKRFRDLQKLSPRRNKRGSGQTQSYAKAFEQFGLNFRLLQLSVIFSFVERFLRRFSQKAPEVEGEQPSARPAGRESSFDAGRRPGPRKAPS